MLYTPMMYAGGMTEEAREARRKRSLLGTEGTAWDVACAVTFLASERQPPLEMGCRRAQVSMVEIEVRDRLPLVISSRGPNHCQQLPTIFVPVLIEAI
jgi:hypothetical protein